MATVDNTNEPTGDTRSRVEVWANMHEGDTGRPVPFAHYVDKSIHVSGASFGGGDVVLEGSNNGGATWETLNDPFGVPLIFSTNKLRQVLECSALVRPRIAGGASVDVSVHLLLKE